MWLMTKLGFYSIVDKTDGYHVRSRHRKDLENLMKKTGFRSPTKILATPKNDYPFRIVVDLLELSQIMRVLANSVDYDNFKDQVGREKDQQGKLAAYHNIWAEMRETQGVGNFKKAKKGE